MPKRLADLIRGAQRILVFTGAGMSTGCGIPDFRGPTGLWTRRAPVYFQEFLASEEGRVRHWEYKLETFDAFRGARPGPAHRALAELERRGQLELLVTQNIDGLHGDAGTSPERLVELHGTNRRVVCLTCGRAFEPGPCMEEFRRARRCPTCPCGGWLKSATVSFGQEMPAAAMARALAGAARADLVVAAGSTLEVYPAASVPLAAARRGAPYAIVNRGPTGHDALATLRLEGDVDEILPAAIGEG